MYSNDRRAEFYRADLADNESLRPLTIALVTIVVAWLIIYLIGSASRRIEALVNLLEDDPPVVMSMVGP
jgi:hypothetical protein